MKKLLFTVLFLASCETVPVAPVPAAIPPPVSLKADWDGATYKNKAGNRITVPAAEYTALLVQALKDHGKALLQGEYQGVCGEKLQYWVSLISAIAKEESSFDPMNTYQEGFEDDKGDPQQSRGLLQVSFDDYKAGCPFKNVAEVYDVKKNLECGVIKMNALVSRDGVVAAGSTKYNAKGGARYWSCLREGPKDGPKKARIFQKALANCR